VDTIDGIEQQLNLKLPDDYKEFLLGADTFVIENHVFCRILQDNYRTDGLIYEFYSANSFIESQKYRDYLIEFQTHFENPKDYVEAEYLYHIANGTGSICIALDGQHYGKIFSADNGDFGIIYQANNINDFVDSLYEPSKFRCTYVELIEVVKNNRLDLLIELVEAKDGNKQIEYSSWLDIELFEIAYKNKFDNILKYLISKGFEGYGRAKHYNFK
jgi:hypothetical protein